MCSATTASGDGWRSNGGGPRLAEATTATPETRMTTSAITMNLRIRQLPSEFVLEDVCLRSLAGVGVPAPGAGSGIAGSSQRIQPVSRADGVGVLAASAEPRGG